jgi:predicted HD superfamily hydrolase involved in NAD metabolism
MEETLALGKRFGFSPEALEVGQIAALLHDCAKQLPFEIMLAKAEEYKLSLSADDLASPQTLHAWVGAAMVAAELDYRNSALLSAIQAHTTGLANMSDLDVLVFVADKIEPRTRDAVWREKVLTHMPDNSLTSLYTAARFILLNTVERLDAAGQPVHPNTRAALAFLIRESISLASADFSWSLSR